jgi:Phosphotransferase enzyme family
MDPEHMRAQLQRVLFDRAGLVVEACERPKAELDESACSLQYPLLVRAESGELQHILVLGTMLADERAAVAFERTALAPLTARWRSSGPQAPVPTGVLEDLGLALSVFPLHAALPSLMEATDTTSMTSVLRSVLDDEVATVTAAELVVLRRTRGCVLRYRLESREHPVVYGKVGYTSSTQAAHAALPALAGSIPARAPEWLMFPRFLGSRDELELSLWSDVPGSRPDLTLDVDVERTVVAAAGVAALLHASPIGAGPARSLGSEVERALAAVRLIDDDTPALAGWLRGILASAVHTLETVPAQPHSLAHGDLTPSQLLFDGRRVGILDFDKLCQAEPALDLGRFLAYLRFALTKRGARSTENLAARFIESYGDQGGQPAPAARVNAYEICSLVRMAARSWLQLKPARLAVVCAVLESRTTTSPRV